MNVKKIEKEIDKYDEKNMITLIGLKYGVKNIQY